MNATVRLSIGELAGFRFASVSEPNLGALADARSWREQAAGDAEWLAVAGAFLALDDVTLADRARTDLAAALAVSQGLEALRVSLADRLEVVEAACGRGLVALARASAETLR